MTIGIRQGKSNYGLVQDAISANVEGKIELLSNPVMEDIFCSKAIGFKNT